MDMNRNSFLLLIGVLSVASVSSKGEELAEASINLDLSKFQPVLQATSKLIDTGFTDSEASGMITEARGTPVGESRRREFAITYRGRKTVLRIEFKRDDEDAVDVWFFTTPALAKLIQQRMDEIAGQ